MKIKRSKNLPNKEGMWLVFVGEDVRSLNVIKMGDIFMEKTISMYDSRAFYLKPLPESFCCEYSEEPIEF